MIEYPRGVESGGHHTCRDAIAHCTSAKHHSTYVGTMVFESAGGGGGGGVGDGGRGCRYILFILGGRDL